MNSTNLFSALVGHFNLGMATSLGEENSKFKPVVDFEREQQAFCTQDMLQEYPPTKLGDGIYLFYVLLRG